MGYLYAAFSRVHTWLRVGTGGWFVGPIDLKGGFCVSTKSELGSLAGIQCYKIAVVDYHTDDGR